MVGLADILRMLARVTSPAKALVTISSYVLRKRYKRGNVDIF